MTTSFPKRREGIAPGIRAPWSMPRLNPAASVCAFDEVADLLRIQPQAQVITKIRARRSRSRSIPPKLQRFLGSAGSGGCILRGGFVSRLGGDAGIGREFMANGKPPVEPSQCVLEWPDFAGFRTVPRFNGDKSDRKSGMKKADDHLRLDFKMVGRELETVPGAEVQHPKAALGIGNSCIAEVRQQVAHDPINNTADEGHIMGAVHSVANEHGGWGSFQRLQEMGN